MPADRTLIYVAALLRALGAGMTPIALAAFLKEAGRDAFEVSMIATAGLAGAALGTLAVGFLADRVGRRRSFLLLAGATAIGGTMLALGDTFAVMVAGAALGMTNAMGRDRGAAFSLEQAAIPSTTTDSRRTSAFAAYNVVLAAGHFAGPLLAGVPPLRYALLVPPALAVVSAVIYCFLSPRVDTAAPAALVSPRSRGIIAKLSALSFVDSFGGGFLVSTLISYWFFARFDVSVAELGALFAAGAALQIASFPAAAWIARRIGLVNTMVFTHIPASLFLMAVPFAPSFGVAAALWLTREFLVEMDVPTRQSYIAAVVAPEERPMAASITNMVRQGAWALGTPLAGQAMLALAAAPLFIGGGLKIAYDLSLWFAFRNLKPPEES